MRTGRPGRASRTLGAAVALAAAAAAAVAAHGDELPRPPPIASPPPLDWGQAYDLGHGFLVAAVSIGAVGFALEAGFPWEELARCAPASAVRDPAGGDPASGVHRFSLEGRAGALNVTAEHPGVPPLAAGCAARALAKAALDSPATGPAEVALAVVPRARLRHAPTVAVVAARSGSAAERTVVATNALGAAEYCRDRFGPSKGGAEGPLTGRVELKLVTREDAILELVLVRTPFAGKEAARCLGEAITPPLASDPKARKEKARVAVRFVAGGRFAVEGPERLAERLLAWSRAMDAARGTGAGEGD